MVQKYYKPVSPIVPVTITITSNNDNATSAAFDIGGGKLVGLTCSATFTGATYTFTTCDSLAGTYETYRNAAGTVLTVTPTAGSRTYFDPNLQTAGLSQFVKIVSASNEAANRTLTAYVDNNR